MRAVVASLVIIAFISRYFLFRLGLVKRPIVDEVIESVTIVAGLFVGVPKHFHLIDAEHLPKNQPLIVCSNHSKLDDPLLVYHAARMASGGGLHLRIMMRDDYFVGPLFENRVVKAVEFFKCLGAYPISRDNVSVSQLKPFLRILEEGGGFIIFPGRTRTRSGVFIEYRDGFNEPGGVSFFLHQTQRRHPELTVAAVPIVRNFNPVSKRTALILGPPLQLAHNATREQLRQFDYDLVLAMANLVEINAAQMLGLMLYLHALHNITSPKPIARYAEAIGSILAETAHPHVDPADRANPERATRHAALYFRDRGLIRLDGPNVLLNPQKILHLPALTNRYKKENPIRYLTNQIFHLPNVTAAAEHEALILW